MLVMVVVMEESVLVVQDLHLQVVAVELVDILVLVEKVVLDLMELIIILLQVLVVEELVELVPMQMEAVVLVVE